MQGHLPSVMGLQEALRDFCKLSEGWSDGARSPEAAQQSEGYRRPGRANELMASGDLRYGRIARRLS